MNATPDQYGYIVDSAVSSLRYQSGAHFGVTDQQGRFGFISGESVQFYIGNIAVGSPVEGKTRLTPYDLAEGDADVTINISQLLQTLDNDADPSNGISINDPVHLLAEQVELDLKSSGWTESSVAVSQEIQLIVSELTSATDAGSRYLVSRYDAYLHLAETLDGIIDDLESEVVSAAEQSSCETSEQCVIGGLRPKYSGHCPRSGVAFAYSQLDIDQDFADKLISERSTLIDIREELRDSVVEPWPMTGICVIFEYEAFGVCNDLHRCEIQY